MAAPATTEPFALYDRFGFVLCSGGFIPRLKPDGGLDKGFSHDSVGWKDATSRRFLPGRPGYAILTGAVSGVTAVDVDDPEAPHNAQLIPLLRAHSNLIARTRKGFHFLFAYDARIRTVSNNSLGLDTRNDGGLLYVAPSHYTHPATGEEIAYTWERVPADDEPLGALPEAIVKQMTRLWANYVKPLAPPAETGNVAYYTKSRSAWFTPQWRSTTMTEFSRSSCRFHRNAGTTTMTGYGSAWRVSMRGVRSSCGIHIARVPRNGRRGPVRRSGRHFDATLTEK